MIAAVKQVLSKGIPGNRQTRKTDTAILQAFYKKHTGRTVGGCSPCRFKTLFYACKGIIEKNGL